MFSISAKALKHVGNLNALFLIRLFVTKMKTICSLLLFIFMLITGCLANTEKLILEARLSNVENECNPAPFNTISMTPPYTKIQHSLIPQSESHEGSSKQYHLNDLIDGSKYEIRVSYPAIVSSNIRLTISFRFANNYLNCDRLLPISN